MGLGPEWPESEGLVMGMMCSSPYKQKNGFIDQRLAGPFIEFRLARPYDLLLQRAMSAVVV